MRTIGYYLLGFVFAYVLSFVPFLIASYPFTVLLWLFGTIDSERLNRLLSVSHIELFGFFLAMLQHRVLWAIWIAAGVLAGLIRLYANNTPHPKVTVFMSSLVLIMLIYLATILSVGMMFIYPLLSYVMHPVIITIQFYMGVLLAALFPRVSRVLNETRVEDILSRVLSIVSFRR